MLGILVGEADVVAVPRSGVRRRIDIVARRIGAAGIVDIARLLGLAVGHRGRAGPRSVAGGVGILRVAFLGTLVRRLCHVVLLKLRQENGRRAGLVPGGCSAGRTGRARCAQRSLRVERPIRARISEMIQKRITICGSAQPFFSKWWWIGAIRNTRRPVRLK